MDSEMSSDDPLNSLVASMEMEAGTKPIKFEQKVSPKTAEKKPVLK